MFKLREFLFDKKDDEITVDAGGSNEPVTFIDDGDNTVVDLSPEKEYKKEPVQQQPVTDPNLVNVLSDIRNRLNNPPPSNQPTGPDPYQAELDRINQEERAYAIEWETLRAANKLDAAAIDKFDAKSREINDRRSAIHAQKALRSMLPQIANLQQAQVFQNEYSDVVSNERAHRYAKGTYDRLLAEGHADGPELVKRSMNEARIKFNMIPKSQPTDNDRQQLTGVNGGGSRPTVDNKVRLGKAEKSMAMSMFGKQFNGDEQKAYQAWAKGPGLEAKREAEKIARNGR